MKTTFIKDLGKFEGEPHFAPTFHELALDGFSDEEFLIYDEHFVLFHLAIWDRAEPIFKAFPELKNVAGLCLEYKESGFVYTHWFTNPFEFLRFRDELQVAQADYQSTISEEDEFNPIDS